MIYMTLAMFGLYDSLWYDSAWSVGPLLCFSEAGLVQNFLLVPFKPRAQQAEAVVSSAWDLRTVTIVV